MLTQLNPPLPVVTPKGRGLAHLVIDYGIEHHLMWVCFLDQGGECWTFPNPQVRLQTNVTAGRTADTPAPLSAERDGDGQHDDVLNGRRGSNGTV